MALGRTGRRETGFNYWPGFVDALSTMLLAFIFLLSMFMLAQFFLTQEITGKENVLARLTAQIRQLSDLLSLERSSTTSLEDQIAQLRASLRGAEAERDRLRGPGTGPDVPALATELDSERKLNQQQISQIALLNQQIAALRRQLAAIEAALEVSEKRDRDSQARIADLGRRLNVALAQRVQELQRYRSEFFGRLREILGNRPEIRVVGDRFVLQSEVFFDRGSAALGRGAARDRQDRERPSRPRDQDSRRHRLGAAHRRPYRHPPDRDGAIPVELGAVVRARDLGGAVPDRARREARAAGRGRLRRIPADRPRRH